MAVTEIPPNQAGVQAIPWKAEFEKVSRQGRQQPDGKKGSGPPGSDPDLAPEFTIDEVPLALPDPKRKRDPNRPETLIEIVARREAELHAQAMAKQGDGKPVEKQKSSFDDDDDELGPVGNALLYTLSLASFHFMIDVLVYNQYAAASADEPFDWVDMLTRTCRVIPVLAIATWLMHTTTAKRTLRPLRQVAFLAGATVTGTTLIWSGNKMAYYAVMKRAPPLATLWIWSVVELDPAPALLSAILVGVWAWWNELGLF